ncbi:ATP-binding protein [Proteinivorax hydrogeniformans]|uniref:ATP-binding protein n=1 Tax=Proteinivorax hydrogeniformans TaxID=1826727 RepID=A0AAU8HUN7_9FIRM
MKIQYKITLAIALLIIVLILVLTVFMYGNWYSSVQKQVALDAKDHAIIIAEQEALQRAMMLDNGYISVNRMVESIHLKTGIQYLYIVNMEGRYFAHPIPDKVNTYHNQNDTKLDPLVSSPTYHYSLYNDAMVEAYVPIYTDGIQSGAVVVGMYNGRILQTIKGHAFRLVMFSSLAMILGVFIAYGLSKNIKKNMYDLEPEAIALLLNQQETVLEQIGEGIVATNHMGEILLINENAKNLLEMPNLRLGMKINTIPIFKLFGKLPKKDNKCEEEWRINENKIVKVQVVDLQKVSERLGFLYKIEDMSLVRQRAEELTNMQQLTQALRAQNHEFMNKLHTITGLIQLDEYDEALNYIEKITKARKAMVDALNQRIKVPAVAGLILAKHSKGAERKIELIIDEEAHISKIPKGALEEDITSIIGNLIDNAMDVLAKEGGGKIYLDMYQDSKQFSITVWDDGPGMSDTCLEKCFEKGFSTKGEDRGYGLYIVKNIVDYLNGHLELKNQEGLCCKVYLPMERKEV